jgi:hypothetical protein
LTRRHRWEERKLADIRGDVRVGKDSVKSTKRMKQKRKLEEIKAPERGGKQMSRKQTVKWWTLCYRRSTEAVAKINAI